MPRISLRCILLFFFFLLYIVILLCLYMNLNLGSSISTSLLIASFQNEASGEVTASLNILLFITDFFFLVHEFIIHVTPQNIP